MCNAQCTAQKHKRNTRARTGAARGNRRVLSGAHRSRTRNSHSPFTAPRAINARPARACLPHTARPCGALLACSFEFWRHKKCGCTVHCGPRRHIPRRVSPSLHRLCTAALNSCPPQCDKGTGGGASEKYRGPLFVVVFLLCSKVDFSHLHPKQKERNRETEQKKTSLQGRGGVSNWTRAFSA